MLVSNNYDTVFRTLVNDCPDLLIPFVNEVFGEHFSSETPIIFHPNEHFINQTDGNLSERITDTCFEILGDIPKKYHIECQSTADNSMLIRMFEYGAQIALDQGELKENILTVNFPNSAVLYLRCTKNTPDKICVIINTPAGKLNYEVAVVKIHSYTLEKIFHKKLLFLIPFYIFTHESLFSVYNDNEEQLKILKAEYQLIQNKLEKLSITGEITEYTKRILAELSVAVINYLAKNYAKVQKGVSNIMLGATIETNAKKLLNQGISQGISQGVVQGKLDTILELLREGLISISTAAQKLDLSEEEVKKMLK